MAWTNIPDANLDAGSPLRDVDLMALRDNTTHARNEHGMVAFSASGTFTPVPGVTTYRVTLYGGGGGGGGSYPAFNGNGGAGGYGGVGIFYLYGITTPQYVTIGGGGAGGALYAAGNPGGNSSIGGMVASGGGGGGAGCQHGAYTSGDNGANGGCGGLGGHAGVMAAPFYSAYGWAGPGGVAAGDNATGGVGTNGNHGLCIIEW